MEEKSNESLMEPLLKPGASSEPCNIKTEPLCSEVIINSSKQYTLKDNGDNREKEFANSDLYNKVLNYEKYWNLAIAPATNRPTSISIRNNIHDEVLLLCQFNYSILVYLHRADKARNDKNKDGRFRDFFSYLQQSKEQLELFCLVRELAMDVSSRPSSNWNDLLNTTDQLKNQEKRAELLKKCQCSDLWNQFKSKANVGMIERMRNALCHGPEIAVYEIDSITSAPRLNKHSELLWTFVPEQKELRKMKGYFKEEQNTMNKVIEEYADCLNDFYRLFLEKDRENFSREVVKGKYNPKSS